jgi:hypothetical protein
MFEICGWCVTRGFHKSDNPPHFLPRHTPYPKWVVAFPKIPIADLVGWVSFRQPNTLGTKIKSRQ